MPTTSSGEELSERDERLAAVSTAATIDQPSPFWKELGERHTRQLEESGFDNFKRTVNIRYFNWRVMGLLRHQFAGLLFEWLRNPDWAVLSAEFPDRRSSRPQLHSFSALGAWIYKTFVAMFAAKLSKTDTLAVLRTLEEPALGNPFVIRYRGRRLSQDLCNSIHELYSVLDWRPRKAAAEPLSIAEIGAGYGRLAHVFLESGVASSYTIIDIPPALQLSQRYLTTLLPHIRAFPFREFEHFDDVRDEFEGATLRFMMPYQLECLPDRYFSHFINISSFHEMTLQQVQQYFDLIQRLCRERVYLKQWRTYSQAGMNGRPVTEADYPIPLTWRAVFHRQHPIQRMFFEALYELP